MGLAQTGSGIPLLHAEWSAANYGAAQYHVLVTGKLKSPDCDQKITIRNSNERIFAMSALTRVTASIEPTPLLSVLPRKVPRQKVHHCKSLKNSLLL